MEKKLPIALNPIIRSRTPYANFCSIAANHPKFQDWLVENIVQISISCNNPLTISVGYQLFPNFSYTSAIHFLVAEKASYCPFIKINTLPYDEPKEWDLSIVEYMKKMINNDYYIYLVLDKSQYASGETKYFPHEGLIYGYDDDKQVFYRLDYLHGFYRSFEITYEETINAYQELLNRKTTGNYSTGVCIDAGISKIKYLPESDFTFRIKNMKRFLNDYLRGYEVDEDYRRYYRASSQHFGISCYDCLATAWETILSEGRQNERSVINFSLLKEHKVIMKMRFDYLHHNGYINLQQYETLMKQFQNVLDLSVINEQLFLKGKMTQNEAPFRRIIANLSVMEQDERRTLEYLLSII